MRIYSKQALKLYPPSTHAMLRGWKLSAARLGPDSGRRHIVRPALSGEISDAHRQVHPHAVVCACYAFEGAIKQYVLPVTEAAVDAFRTDSGEAFARAYCDLAEHHPALQRRELISIVATEPRIMGMHLLSGAEPPAGWLVAMWEPALTPGDALLQRAGLARAA